jgi:hypothetical protein
MQRKATSIDWKAIDWNSNSVSKFSSENVVGACNLVEQNRQRKQGRLWLRERLYDSVAKTRAVRLIKTRRTSAKKKHVNSAGHRDGVKRRCGRRRWPIEPMHVVLIKFEREVRPVKSNHD